MISVNDDDIAYYGRDRTIETKRSRQLSEVEKGLIAVPSGLLVEPDVDVNIWR